MKAQCWCAPADRAGEQQSASRRPRKFFGAFSGRIAMTTKSFSILFASACLACWASSADAFPSGEQSPFLGKWQLDLTKMPDTYGSPPKSVTFTFRDVGSGQWRTTVEIVGSDGSVRHTEVQYRRDGKMVKGEGDDSEADSVAFNSPAPNVLVASMAKNKS